jgi:hypothetical protein
MSWTRSRSLDQPDESLAFDHGGVDWVVIADQTIAVHEPAWVVAAAAQGEVLVTAITRDLTAGVGLFLRGPRRDELRGFDGVRRLFAVAGASLPLGVPVK